MPEPRQSKIDWSFWICQECGERYGRCIKTPVWYGHDADHAPGLRTRCSICDRLRQVTQKWRYNLSPKHFHS